MTDTQTTSRGRSRVEHPLREIRAVDDGDVGDGGRPRVVTLCGSMRFLDRMLAVAAELTTAGDIVLAPFQVVPAAAQHGERAAEKQRLDQLHRRKIDLCDAVVVVSDPSGYYGASTRGEIAYARALGLPVTFREVRDVEEVGEVRRAGYCWSAAHDAALAENGFRPDTVDAGDDAWGAAW